MKKSLIKMTVFVVVFLISLVVVSKIMNKGQSNLTMEMAEATLPIVLMERDGEVYNELHGYKVPMDSAFQRDVITVLGEGRVLPLQIDTYGRAVTGLHLEVRSLDGERLVESTSVENFQVENGRVSAQPVLKDLLEKNTEYSVILTLTLDEQAQAYYYTRIVWSDEWHVEEKLAFVKDFHERLYNRDEARALTRYLETNSSLESNTSFHKVNIHSSFRQITWGDLKVREVETPMIRVRELDATTGSFLMDYTVATNDGDNDTFYRVQEYYRVRYTADRMYLLNYERTMTQIPQVSRMYANDKILLGITELDVHMRESGDGSTVVFVVDNQLYSYNTAANKLSAVFGFYDEEHTDARDRYNEHAIKILDVSEGGNVNFAVYGYMNRGRHEGEVGIQLYTYDSSKNTLEENVYIPYDKSYAVLKPQVEQLLYLNRNQLVYLTLEGNIYEINLEDKNYRPIVEITQDDSVQVSENHKILMWQQGDDIYHSNRLNVNNLSSGVQSTISVKRGEAIRPLGFIGEDIIYGVAREEEIRQESSGRIFFPMYKVCICDDTGKTIKEYSQENIYTISVAVEDNQITLGRVERRSDDRYVEIADDHIMNSVESEGGKNSVVVAHIDIYESYVQIQTKKAIDSKTIQILTPSEVVFEGGRTLSLDSDHQAVRYYVYGPYSVEAICSAPATAVNLAYQKAGVVTDQNGNRVWAKTTRVARNQIMAIREHRTTEEKDSLAVSMDTLLEYEGVIRNSEYLLAQGQTVLEILQDNLPNAQVLDLTGCSMDAVLYYVNRDIPVLALLEDGNAVLVTGFNEFNTVIMNPAAGTLAKKGMNDSSEWFSQNGNQFITYIRR